MQHFASPLTFYAGASPVSRAAIPANMSYSLFASGALGKQDVMNETGLIQVDHHPTTQQYTLKRANGGELHDSCGRTVPGQRGHEGQPDACSRSWSGATSQQLQQIA